VSIEFLVLAILSRQDRFLRVVAANPTNCSCRNTRTEIWRGKGGACRVMQSSCSTPL
jgi:hypothetical protein